MGIISYIRDFFDDSPEGVARRILRAQHAADRIIEKEKDRIRNQIHNVAECILFQEDAIRSISNDARLWETILANRPHDLINGHLPHTLSGLQTTHLDLMRHMHTLMRAYNALQLHRHISDLANKPFHGSP